MRRSNFALRLQPSLLEEVRKAAEMEGVALNQLINVAVAEKISALRTEEYFRERSMRANRAETMRILARAGRANEPMAGDELPEEINAVTLDPKRKQPLVGRKRRQRTASRGKKVRG
ncbi:MAG: toxin-antitoxin system HicB family antitoxin [Candidatus Acidiferrum sp.]